MLVNEEERKVEVRNRIGGEEMTEHPWINGQNDVGLSLKCYFYIIYYNVCNFTHNPLDNVSSLAYNKCTSPAFLSLIVNRKHVISLSDFSIFNYL